MHCSPIETCCLSVEHIAGTPMSPDFGVTCNAHVLHHASQCIMCITGSAASQLCVIRPAGTEHPSYQEVMKELLRQAETQCHRPARRLVWLQAVNPIFQASGLAFDQNPQYHAEAAQFGGATAEVLLLHQLCHDVGVCCWNSGATAWASCASSRVAASGSHSMLGRNRHVLVDTTRQQPEPCACCVFPCVCCVSLNVHRM